MNIYLYDGTFEGLLTSIYEAYYSPVKPDQIMQEATFQPNLIDQVTVIETDPQKADKVYDSIERKISPLALRHVYEVYLSEDVDAGTIIYRYLQLGYKIGDKVTQYSVHEDVLPVFKISRRIWAEQHRLLGLVRFKLLENGGYYAPLEPDHNVVALIAPHFAERMGDLSWMIHDLKRGIAALGQRGQWIMTPMGQEELSNISQEEKEFQTLWRTYYKHITIPERINPKLQKSMMPVRYWKYLTEKQNSLGTKKVLK